MSDSRCFTLPRLALFVVGNLLRGNMRIQRKKPWASSRSTPTIHFLTSILKRAHHQARNLSKEFCRDGSVKGVRKCKGDAVLDESRFLTPSGIRNRLKLPGGFKGFEEWRGGGCDSLRESVVLIHKGCVHHEG